MSSFRLGVAAFALSLLTTAPALAQQQTAAHAEIAAAETNLNVSLGFIHTNYSEGPLDSENGFTPGFGVGASVLVPSMWSNIDLYSSIAYQFNAGNLTYNGHYLVSGLPLDATDRAVFNNFSGRLGLGLPVAGAAAEVIPYVTAGYQAWNRNVSNPGVIGTDEFYSAATVGGGVKLDIPITASVVASGSAEMLGILGAHVQSDSFGIGFAMGNSAEERVSLGVDEAVSGPLHLQASADLTHFNYAGSKPSDSSYGLYEPTSTTTQVGVNLGVSYSF